MKIQVNSDKHVAVDASLTKSIKEHIEHSLARFEQPLTRVEVHLSDLNSAKPGPRDKRCLIEARPAGRPPVSVSHDAESVEAAVRGAVGKLQRLLQTSFGRTATKASRTARRSGESSATSPVTLRKLERIEAALAEVLSESSAGSANLDAHVKRASEAVRKAKSLVGSSSATPAPVRRAGPSSATPAPARKAGPPTDSSRGSKKKQIYPARRKSWPSR